MKTMDAGARRRWLAHACTWSAALLIAGGLAGCATTAITESSELGPDQGVATVRVVSLHARTLKHLLVRNLATQQEYKLVPQPGLGGDSYRFTGLIPAGSYQTREIYGSDVEHDGIGQRQYTLKVPMDRDVNRFEVKAGGLANLGTMVFIPLADSRFIAPREGTPVAAREWLRYANPGLAAKLQGGPETTWSVPVPPEEAALLNRQIAYAQGRATPIAMAVVDVKGTPWSTGQLGSVFDLEKGTRYYTDTVHQLTTVAPLADGRLLVAGEEGYVAMSSPDRKTWRQLATPVSNAAVALLATQAPDGTVYLVSRTPVGVAVHAADPQAFTWSWREVRRIERPGVGSTAEGGMVAFVSLGQARPMAVTTRERLVIYTSDPELFSSLDYGSGTWESRKPESRALRMRGSPDGLVYTMSAAPSFWGTTDYGTTWFEMDRFFQTTLPVFTSRTEGYVLASPFSSWKAAPALYKTTDGGKTWAPVGSLPRNMDRFWRGYLVQDSAGQRLGYVNTSGSIAWTRDEGKNWR